MPPAGQAVAGPDDSPRAVELLRRSALAHRTLAYEGTKIVTGWDTGQATTLVLDLRHVPGQGTAFRVRGGTSPSTAMFVTQREAATGPEALEGGQLRLLADNFSLNVSGIASSGGRQTVVVTASADQAAVARFWLDRSTGLLVRREVYGLDGSMSRSSAFVDLVVEPSAFLEHLPPTLPQPSTVAVSAAAMPRLVGAGWSCRGRLPGGFALTEVARLRADAPVVHTSYSDGLSTISVFQQRGTLGPAALTAYQKVQIAGTDVYVRYGLPTYLSWAAGDTVYTVVTDAPSAYLSRIVLSYPAEEPTGLGFWERLWRGIGRMLGWLAPLSAQA